MKFREIVSLVMNTIKEWREDQAPRLAAALAYYTTFSLAPVLVIATGVGIAVSQALFESMIFDGGQLQNGNLGDYMISSGPDMPRELSVTVVESPDRHEIHGVGETSLPAVMPAIGNAIFRATGVHVGDLEAERTQERVQAGVGRRQGRSFPGAEAPGDELEPAPAHDCRIELLERAGDGVARVAERRLGRRFRVFTQPLERRAAEDHLAAELLVERLIAWDVETVFGLPGDGINGIMEALRRHGERIRFVLVHHEEAAAFMAAGYAKTTGRLGVCLATSGPGGIHLLNGLYDAKLDGQPVLAITGHHYHDLIDTFAQQDVDLDRVFADVSVYSTRTVRLGPPWGGNGFLAPNDEELEQQGRRVVPRRRERPGDARDRARILAVAKGRCPKCAAQLVEVHYHGVELDKCSGCGGVWLDVGELERVAEDKGFLTSVRKIFG